MATDLERLVVSLEANITKFEREFRRAREQTNTNARAIEKRTEEMGSRIDKIMSTSAAAISTGFSKIGGLIGATLSVSALKGYSDAWTEAGNKIAAAGEQGAVAAQRQSELAAVAMRARSDFGAVVELYTGLYRATEELGISQSEVAQITETIAKAFTVGGQSAATAAGAITQLNQAFSAGKLSGDELNSVLEGAPPLARLIAAEFGVGVGKLKKLAEDGKLDDRTAGCGLQERRGRDRPATCHHDPDHRAELRQPEHGDDEIRRPDRSGGRRVAADRPGHQGDGGQHRHRRSPGRHPWRHAPRPRRRWACRRRTGGPHDRLLPARRQHQPHPGRARDPLGLCGRCVPDGVLRERRGCGLHPGAVREGGGPHHHHPLFGWNRQFHGVRYAGLCREAVAQHHDRNLCLRCKDDQGDMGRSWFRAG